MSDSEEEILIVVESSEILPPPTCENTFKILGLDSDNPIVQYQKQVFRGDWRDTVGTKVLFAEKEAPAARDPVFSADIPKIYEYATKTTKVLKLRPYVLNAADESTGGRQEEEEDEQGDDEEDEEEEERIEANINEENT